MMVTHDNEKAQAAGSSARAGRAEVLSALIGAAFRARGLLLPGEAPAPVQAAPPAPPPVASTPGEQGQILATLVKLDGETADGLIDAAALVKASGMPMPLATAALLALAAAGKVELRPAGEATRRPADQEPGYPRSEAGFIIQYVRHLAPKKASRPPAPARASKPSKGKTKPASRKGAR